MTPRKRIPSSIRTFGWTFSWTYRAGAGLVVLFGFLLFLALQVFFLLALA
jgi:hypothetical protein